MGFLQIHLSCRLISLRRYYPDQVVKGYRSKTDSQPQQAAPLTSYELKLTVSFGKVKPFKLPVFPGIAESDCIFRLTSGKDHPMIPVKVPAGVILSLVSENRMR